MDKNNGKLDKLRIFSGAQLKYIAFLSMLADHVNKALIYPFLSGEGILQRISDAFDILGRIAFPLFAFFLVEGFFKTGNRKKYLASLLIFGIISEIPFDMALSGVFFEPNSNNIMFTLALMLITIWIIDTLKEKMQNMSKYIWYPFSFVIVGIMCIISMVTGLDYEYHAIMIGYLFYIFYNKRVFAIFLGYLAIFKEVWSLLGFSLILTYNGKRGKQNKLFNYCFYPVHLLILGILRIFLKI
jgi:protein traX